MPNGEQPVSVETNSSDVHENEAVFIITTDSQNDVNDATQSQNERLKSDVSNRNEAHEAASNENSDWPDSKIPFRDYSWVGPFMVHKVLRNENYVVRRLNTIKIQMLHCIRLKKFVPNQPLEDSFREEQLQPDEEMQDDLYTISW